LQSGSGDELRPFAPPGMILRNSGKIGICAQGNSTARPFFKKLPRRDKGNVRVRIEEGGSIRICCEKFPGHERLVVAKVPIRIALEKANLASIEPKRLGPHAFELISPWRELISVPYENCPRKLTADQ
jgi:hypothetical protein